MSPDTPPQVRVPDTDGNGAHVDILTIVLMYAVFASLWIVMSDKTVGWLFTDPVKITLVNTVKGLAFVAATSMLLYGSMRRLLKRAGGADPAVVSLRTLALPLGLLIIAIVALTGGAIVQTVVHNKEKEVAKLRTIADLKAGRIGDWLDERDADARSVHTNTYWSGLYRRWRDDGDAASRNLLQWRLSQLQKYNSFQNALLLDDQCEPLWSSNGEPVTLDPALREAARQAAHDQKVMHLGPYRDKAGGMHLDFIAPLPPVGGRPGPIVILHADPAKYLFSTLKTWPEPSPSGETLLFRRDGDKVEFLNELRHRADTAAKLRLPVSEKNLPAALILRREAREGSLVEGLDYRNVPVMAVVRAIRGTDWFLMAKMDKAELYAKSAGDAIWIALVGLLSLFVAATGAFVFRQRRELAASLREQESQAEKLRALQLLDAIAEGSADSIYAKDLKGRYLLFNCASARAMGRKPLEVLGLDDTAIFPPEQAAVIMANDRQVMAGNFSITFQEDVTTVDGETSLHATKGPLHDAAGNVIGIFGISRDVTELKRAEKERELTVDFLRLVNESVSKDGMIRAATAFFQERSGCEAVGIRLKEGYDYPYYETRGFPAEFVRSESSLCARRHNGEVILDSQFNPVLECMCGNVICGRFDPSKPFFSKNGSFWSNCTTQLLATTTDKDRKARTRNRCNGEGYESVALVALRVGENRLGLLQLNDRREGRFSPEDIALWERLAGYLAVALAKLQAEERRCESEQQFKAMFELASIGMAQADPKTGRWLRVNQKMCEITGYSSDEMLEMRVPEITHPEDRERDWKAFQDVVSVKSKDYRLEKRYIRKDGTVVWVNVNMTVIRDPAGQPMRTIATIEDITERRRAEELRRHHEMILREAAEIAHVGGWEFDPVTLEGSWSEETARIHDIDPEAATDATLGMSFYHGESRARIEAAIKEAIESGTPYDLELELVSAKGSHKWVRTICHPIVRDDRVLKVRGALQDITERRRSEEVLRNSLEEKVALLKEVHHRVKNNLQIVASLLSLQASRTPTQEVADVLRDTRNRVRSMAILHEVLYRSGNLARINFAAYISELCIQLLRSYGPASARIKLDKRVAPIGLALEHAVPCGLIVSELVSNSLKHGFPEDREGRVAVELQPDDGQRLVLCVSDDGVGLPSGFDISGTSTLGLKLVSNLAGQLGGQLAVERPSEGGAAFRVVFPFSKDTPLRGES